MPPASAPSPSGVRRTPCWARGWGGGGWGWGVGGCGGVGGGGVGGWGVGGWGVGGWGVGGGGGGGVGGWGVGGWGGEGVRGWGVGGWGVGGWCAQGRHEDCILFDRFQLWHASQQQYCSTALSPPDSLRRVSNFQVKQSCIFETSNHGIWNLQQLTRKHVRVCRGLSLLLCKWVSQITLAEIE